MAKALSAERQAQLDKAKAELDSPRSKQAFQQLKESDKQKEQRWKNEIAMLERRVGETVDIDLGKGDTLSIRANLSEAESIALGKLNNERITKTTKPERRQEIIYEMIEMVTANPLITVDWLKRNRKKFAVNDMLKIILGYYDADEERLVNLLSFRGKPAGTVLRDVPAGDGTAKSS